MENLLPWLYLINSVLLIIHEIDSAYWKEWDVFGLPGGITGFLLIHFPLLVLVLYGLILVFQQAFAGLIFSLGLSVAGIFGFGIHMVLFQKGRKEFRTPISISILVAILIFSLAQGTVTVYLL
ncbi:MAG: hypothetical protein GTN81_13830 [Proteobacteria bacterium]|nr:hypothetical protein [Pseudomonadota bacterium]